MASPIQLIQRDPYRLFFPLGVALAWGGVLHWFLLGIGALDSYRSIFHSMAQIQGFLTCFALGFLFTMIPRRTGTPPPAVAELAVGAVCPIAIVVLAWFERWAATQVFWLAIVTLIVEFAVRRFRATSSRGRVPPSFVWIPFSFGLSLLGSVLTGAGGISGNMTIHNVGRALVLQGTFTGLVVGVGGMVLPLVTRGEPPAPSPRPPAVTAFYVITAALFAETFFLEPQTPRLAFALRSAVSFCSIALPTRLWRRPTLPGLHRRMVWVAAWMIPIGYATVALLPQYRSAALHLVFIGGFATLVFAVSVHVVLSHGSAAESALLDQSPWAVRSTAALLALALVFRFLVDADRSHVMVWLAFASGAFLTATLAWALFVGPRAARVEGASG